MDFMHTQALERARNLIESALPRGHNARAFYGSAFLGLSSGDIERYSFARAINSLRDTGVIIKKEFGLEREISDQLAKRFDIPLGSIAVPVDVLEARTLAPKYLVSVSAPQELSFIELLRNRSVAYRLGAQRLTDLRNDLAIPRQTTGTTVTWLAPSGSATSSDQAFGQVSGTPKTAIIVTDVSEQLLRQSSADQIIPAALAADMAVGVDVAVINGAGGAEPLGILNTPGIGTASGTSLGYTGVVGLQKTVCDANAILDPRALGYATTPAVAEILKGRQRFTGTDSPVWRGAIHEGEIEGLPAMASKQIPASTLLYGDWSTVVIGEWGPLVLSLDASGTRFNQAQVGIRAHWMVDVFLKAATAFVKVTSIT